MSKQPLTFRNFQRANTARDEFIREGKKPWPPHDFALAAAGPVGYIAHLLTSERRGNDVAEGEIFDEIADAVIYLDLLCSSMGGSLDQVLARKFNVNSHEFGSDITLPERGGVAS